MHTITADDILKTKNILRARADQTLKEALPKLTRSHEGIFIFDDTDTYLGVISPYYTIFQSKYPPNTKLSHCLFHPPKITRDTQIWDIAQLMVESKLYYLPVIEKGEFIGIVTVNRLLRAVQSATEKQPIQINPHDSLITIKKTASVSDAYQLMKDKQISRLPITNETGRLVGIVTRYDIQHAFSKPKQKPRFLSRSGDKEAHTDEPIDKYSTKNVVKLPEDTTGNTIVQTILEYAIGSIILVDNKMNPKGIVSIHDILKAISHVRPKPSPHITVTTPDEFKHRAQLEERTSTQFEKMSKRHNITELSVILKMQKSRISVAMHAKEHTANYHSSATDFDWKKAVGSAFEKLTRQMSE